MPSVYVDDACTENFWKSGLGFWQGPGVIAARESAVQIAEALVGTKSFNLTQREAH